MGMALAHMCSRRGGGEMVRNYHLDFGLLKCGLDMWVGMGSTMVLSGEHEIIEGPC